MKYREKRILSQAAVVAIFAAMNSPYPKTSYVIAFIALAFILDQFEGIQNRLTAFFYPEGESRYSLRNCNTIGTTGLYLLTWLLIGTSLVASIPQNESISIGDPKYLGLLFVYCLCWVWRFAWLWMHRQKYYRAKCRHGVVGALNKFAECRQCLKEEREHNHKVQEELAAVLRATLAEEERMRRAFLKKAKTPEYLVQMDPQKFELLMCELFSRCGYEVKNTPYQGDNGIDGLLWKNGKLTILQSKRVKGYVGEPILRDLYGTMHANNAVEGIVATTGKVSLQAKAWARNKPIQVLELPKIVEMLRAKFREDEIVPAAFVPDPEKPHTCPQCGSALVVVERPSGSFRGCSSYPQCRFTIKW